MSQSCFNFHKKINIIRLKYSDKVKKTSNFSHMHIDITDY